MSKRSITIIRRVLRAALEDAVDEGLLRMNPTARVPVPKKIVKPERPREVDSWDEPQIGAFLAAIDGHRWGGPIRLTTLYGLRRSELLGLTWDDIDLEAGTVRVDKALVEVEGRPVWTEGKNERSRRTFRIDPDTAARLAEHRRFQLEERLVRKAGVPRLTSHGLRHTAATQMVRQATDLGELRAVADILGHSPDSS